ncbi:hypothetical protein [Mesorhizobium sp.]|uniref:hypothetical protein n=2 Tax=Mesorhizobium sp. TaxID=1871066 RepID=UPI0032B004F9
MQQAQRRNFYQLTVETTHRGHYCHQFRMCVSAERDSPSYQEIAGESDYVVIEAPRNLARWLYSQLEQEYDGLRSNEAVDETIMANGYTFTEISRRFG